MLSTPGRTGHSTLVSVACDPKHGTMRRRTACGTDPTDGSTMSASSTGLPVHPQRDDDPPSLGLVRLHGRLGHDDAGSLLAGRHEGRPVVVAWLGAGAETDPYARSRFVDALDDLQHRRRAVVVAWEADPGLAPWAALDGHAEDALELARGLLAEVSLLDPTAGQGRTVDFRPHWWRRSGSGRWRVWPLPWPRLLHAYRGWTFVVSGLVIAALCALALLISAIVLDAPEDDEPGPQPFPTSTPGQPTTTRPTPTPTPTPTATRTTRTTTVPPQI